MRNHMVTASRSNEVIAICEGKDLPIAKPKKGDIEWIW